jgi:hypothetical protein
MLLCCTRTEVDVIRSPFDLNYEYHGEIYSDDGIHFEAYIESGLDELKKDSWKYIWQYSFTKSPYYLPAFTDRRVVSIYEYRTNFSRNDFFSTQNFIDNILGDYYNIFPAEPYEWFDESVSLLDAYNYTSRRRNEATLLIFNEEREYLIMYVFDPKKNGPLREGFLVLIVYNFNT